MSTFKYCSHHDFVVSLINKYGKVRETIHDHEFYNMLSAEDKEKFKENFIQHRKLCENEAGAETSFFKKFIRQDENGH